MTYENCWHVKIENDSILVKVPNFDIEVWNEDPVTKISQMFYAYVKEHDEIVYWDTDKEVWVFNLTERNLFFLYNYLDDTRSGEDVIFDEDVSYYLKEISKVESQIQKYLIQLDYINDKPYIKNASKELKRYIKKNKLNSVYELVDKSVELCYGLSNNVIKLLDESVEHIMISNQYVTLYNGDEDEQKKLKEIIQYALKYNRTPIVFYHPGTRVQTPANKKYHPTFSDLVTGVINDIINKNKISVIKEPVSDYMKSIPPLNFKLNCHVYYTYSLQAIIQSQIKPQLIFFTRLVNEASFNIFLDQIPKVCYYSNVKTSDHGMVGPGNNYYAKV